MSRGFNGRMRDELLNESLFFGLDHARSAIAEWAADYNHFPATLVARILDSAGHAGIIDDVDRRLHQSYVQAYEF